MALIQEEEGLMALIRFRPFSQDLSSDLTDVHAQVNRLLDGFLGQPPGSGKIERVWAPTADMYETKNQFVVTTELPGLSEKDIHLSLTDDVLTIKGERQWTGDVEEGSHHRREPGSASSSVRSRCPRRSMPDRSRRPIETGY
jgi:HSP20 family protein